jgi:acetate kinase
MIILVLNCGSSSIKFQVIDVESKRRLIGGSLTEIGAPQASFTWKTNERRQSLQPGPIAYESGIALILQTITGGAGRVIEDLDQLDAIGHRVVHGGEQFTESTLITSQVLAEIERCSALAPLHNPANLLGIRTCKNLLPETPQVAVFDTAFHQTIPEHAYLYAIPYSLYEQYGLRRYGFHGTSHRYVSSEAARILGKEGNFITLHLGNGASVTAIRKGQSVDTSMGITPLEGLVMGTRSGDLDPSLVEIIADRERLSTGQTLSLLNKKSGLAGLSGGESDMQLLLQRAEEGDAASKRAIEVFCYRARKYVGAYMAVLGEVDALIFTGGIGENASPVRELICRGLQPLGIHLDAEKNRSPGEDSIISDTHSRITIMVIPTNEELMIALDTYRIARGE